MNKKHKKTLDTIFDDPVKVNIVWRDIEAMLLALGAEISEGNGSRIRVVLHDVRAIFHRPHPQPEANKGIVKAVRRFLKEAGVKP